MDAHLEAAECTEEKTENLEIAIAAFYDKLQSSNFAEVSKHFGDICKLSSQLNIDPVAVEEAAKVLADYIKECGPFKKNKIMHDLYDLDFVPKILLGRHFGHTHTTGFPLETFLSENNKKKEGRFSKKKWIKRRLPYPMALGVNNNGKLGIDSDEDAETFKRVYLNGPLEAVFIGEEHTIFCNKKGIYYGSGLTENFLFFRPVEEASKPIEINYIRHVYNDWKDEKVECILTKTSTTFEQFRPLTMYTERTRLIVEKKGNDTEWKEQALESNSDVEIVDLEAEQVVVERHNDPNKKTISIIDMNGAPMKVRIDTKYHYYRGVRRSRPITWFIGGARIHKMKLRNAVYYGNDGCVWIHHQETIYSGNLIFAPRLQEDTIMSLPGENETEEERMNRLIEDEISRQEDILVANMEEINLPYAVEGFAVSPDGKSVIIWPTQMRAEPEHPLNGVSTRVPYDSVNNIIIRGHHHENIDPPTFENVFAHFRRHLQQTWPGKMYSYTGYPTLWGEAVLRIFEEIRANVKICDRSEGLPHLICKLILERDDENADFLERLSSSTPYLTKPRNIPPLVVAAGWSNEEREERAQQMMEKEKQVFAKLLSQIETSLKTFDRIPLGCRQKCFDGAFKQEIAGLMRSAIRANEMYGRVESAGIQVDFIVPCQLAVKDVGKAVQERIEAGDIDPEDERFQLVRVEALGYTSHRHRIYVVYTTRHHICIIFPKFLNYIQDGVLNLSQSFGVNSPSSSEFKQVVDVFFGTTPDDGTNKTIVFANYLYNFPEESDIIDFYIIKTRDNKICKFPKTLFQVHSAGYNAGRIREAERSGTDPDCFEMDASLDALNFLKKCLMDSRYLKHCSISILSELLEIVRYALFTILEKDIIKTIILKAEERDFQVIQDLFFYHSEETLDFVAEFRPEIFVYWKKFPLKGNYLKLLRQIANKIHQLHYKEITTLFGYVEKRPLPIVEPQRIDDYQQIEKEWLVDFLLNGDRDKDVLEDLEKAIEIWDSNATRKRKIDNSSQT